MESVPLPINFKMVHDFHKLHLRDISFDLYKAVIGAIDVYVLDKYYDNAKKKAEAAKRK